MPPHRQIFPSFSAIALALSACASPLASPLEAFHEGRLPAAANAFRRLEPRVDHLSEQDRARYALYRGLTHLGLGDARAADHWLTVAKRLERDDPQAFDAAERGELYAAWRSLGRSPGDD